MAKNRNKKKKNALESMDTTSDQTTVDIPQAMDTSESAASNPSLGASIRKIKRGGVQMKRSKNVRKMKAIQKAISQNEKSTEKISKNESKTARTQSAKKLYD